MKINKTVLQGFGKFENTEFDFNDGLNVVYGGNEAGKTTLHKFLSGAFFGFFRPYGKNKTYTADYDKYYPWSASAYAGKIEYEAQGKHYILERGFDKNNEYVKLYDAVTGEDLTDTLDYDSVTKLPCANRHLGVNSVMFNNTVSIPQMGNLTDDALSEEIGELLVNTTQTLSSDVSYMGAIEALKDKQNKIGTPRQSKSPYGMCVNKLEELKSEYAEAQKVYEQSKESYKKMKQLEERLEGLKQDKQNVLYLQELEELKSYRERYEKYLALNSQLNGLKKELERQIKVSEEDYETYMRLSALSAETKNDIARLNEKIEQKQKEYEIIQAQAGKAEDAMGGDEKSGDMMKDKILLEKTLERLVELKRQRESAEASSVSEEIEEANKKTKLFAIIMTVAAALGLVAGVAGYLLNSLLYFFIGGGLIVIAIVFGVLWFLWGKKRKELEPAFDKFDTVMSRTVSIELMCRTEITRMKEKYGCETVAALRDVLADAEGYTSHLRQFTDAAGKLKVICDELIADRDKKKNDLDAMTEKMKSMLTGANLTSAEELKEEISINRDKNVAYAKFEATQNAAKELLGDMSAQQLKEKAQQAEKTDISVLEEGVDIASRLENINDMITDAASQIANIKGSVAQAESEARPLSDIEEDIQRTEHDVTECEKYTGAYKLAIDTIQSVSKDIHSTFASQFNEYISDTVATVTGGKYDDVKTDEKMHIRAADKTTGRITEIDRLSAGTVDQMYFAVRLAVADMIIQDKTLPVILDDCFVQYDDKRLKNMMQILNNLASQRQIIMFTCRLNEKEVLDKMSIPYNLVEIS